MLIGLKLDIGFAQDPEYRELYGEREILPFLRELGVEAVETPTGPQTDMALLKDHVWQCIDGGMKVSLHPYSEDTICNAAFFAPTGRNPCRQMHEQFFSLAAEIAQRQGYKAVVNLHGAAGSDVKARPYLLSQSIEFFTWAGDWCRRNAPNVVVTTELQVSPGPEEKRARIGDTFQELLKVARTAEVRICWDFGHFQLNTGEGLLFPPFEAIDLIAHVHCHDINGDDHRPLLYGGVPWQEFLNLLFAHSYDGRVILEVPPHQFLKAGGIDSLIKSVSALQAFLTDLRTGTDDPED
jgi:sugar phosphate isomerase/epimerase